LVRHTPRLRSLQICNSASARDGPRPPSPFVEWDALFDALDGHDARLRCWEWDFAAMRVPADLCLEQLAFYHQRPLFRSLHTLRLHHLDRHELKRAAAYYRYPADFLDAPAPYAGAPDAPPFAAVLAQSLHHLPSLTDLVVDGCEIAADGVLLQNLPRSLAALELRACSFLRCGVFAHYLATHGGQLRHLALHHNPHLSLAFLAGLADACPNLQTLTIGRNGLVGLHEGDADGDGDGDGDGLPRDWAPTWPPALHRIEIDMPARWPQHVAVALIQSLLDAAETLPDLRELSIALLISDLEWRSRAVFRQFWERKLVRAFKRFSPAPVVGSFAQDSAVAAAETNGGAARGNGRNLRRRTTASSQPSASASSRPRRAAARAAYRDDEPDDSEDYRHQSTDDTTAVRLGKRHRGTGDDRDSVPYVQGMCDIVHFRVDNMRPMKVLSTLDDLAHSQDDMYDDDADEDWIGQDAIQDDTLAW
ncbi:hypothetical protein KEM52_000610, partial [Ascosphaera acerosa]